MPDLKVKARVYDPAVPFKMFDVHNPAIDTWHDFVLITKKARAYVSQIPEIRQETLRLSGGMSMKVPLIEIGLQIGSIKIDGVEALVVDEGHHDLLLGSEILDRIFRVGHTNEPEARVTSVAKDDPTGLALELYPVKSPVELKFFESVLRHQRRLYNIFLVSLGEIPEPSLEVLDDVINSEDTIPERLRLKLSWIDSGSIWITLVSGSEKALKYLASLYEKGASAKLAQQIADANKAETEAEISQATRDSVAQRIKEEEHMLRTENIAKTYEAWRNEIRANLDFTDELISQISNKQLANELKTLKDEAIIEIVKQKILPIVRNVPRPYGPDDRALLLPPSSLEN